MSDHQGCSIEDAMNERENTTKLREDIDESLRTNNFNLDLRKLDILTFSARLTDEQWTKTVEFFEDIRDNAKLKSFKLLQTCTNSETEIQEVHFFFVQPEQILNLYLIWWCKTFHEENTMVFLYVKSSVMCSTLAARNAIHTIFKLRDEEAAKVALEKESGISKEESLQKCEEEYEELNNQIPEAIQA